MLSLENERSSPPVPRRVWSSFLSRLQRSGGPRVTVPGVGCDERLASDSEGKVAAHKPASLVPQVVGCGCDELESIRAALAAEAERRVDVGALTLVGCGRG